MFPLLRDSDAAARKASGEAGASAPQQTAGTEVPRASLKLESDKPFSTGVLALRRAWLADRLFDAAAGLRGGGNG